MGRMTDRSMEKKNIVHDGAISEQIDEQAVRADPPIEEDTATPTKHMQDESGSSDVSITHGTLPGRALARLVDGVATSVDRFTSLLDQANRLPVYLRRELEVWNEYPLTLRERLHAWSYGFMSRDYALLSLDTNDPNEYLSATMQARAIAPAVTPSYAAVLENKIAFHLATAPYGPDAVPAFYGVIRDGEFDSAPGYTDATNLSGVVSLEGTTILKPATGTAGRGIQRISPREESGYLINGEEVSAAALNEHVKELDDVLVTECVQNHSYATEISPAAANTIRVLTAPDPDTGELFVASAVHRFAASGTGPTDNWSGGGCAAPVDVESGRLGQLHIHAPETGLQSLDHHPTTGTLVAGTQIPEWETVKETILEVARIHRENPWVGWDVVVTSDGAVLLEGNCAPHLALQQLGDGLLTDDRVRRYIESRL